jgi:hypothetical protein
MRISCLLGGVAVAVVLFLFDPARAPIYPTCPFHQLTGFDCPACGSLRALHQLLHGNLVAALHFNAFLILSLPLFAWLGVRWVGREIKGTLAPAPRPLWVWLYLAAWLVFGIVRDLKLPPFESFAP